MTNQPMTEPTVLQLEALVRPTGLVEALLREVEKMALGSCPPAERPARLRELEREIEQLEHVEEQLVLAALERNEAVERRGDASPASILGVKVAAPKPAPSPERKTRVLA
jgi:hypothetical protein